MWYIGTCVCLSHHLWDPLTYVDAAGTGSRVKKFTAVCRDCWGQGMQGKWLPNAVARIDRSYYISGLIRQVPLYWWSH